MARLNILGLREPGVFFDINTDAQIRAALPRTSDTMFDVGKSVWGPVGKPFTVTQATLLTQLGPLVAGANLTKSAIAFLRNYGSRVIACRVADANALVPTITLPDRLAVATWRIDGKYPTEEPILVTIDPGSEPDTVKLTEEAPTLGYAKRSYDNIKTSFTSDEQVALNAGISKFRTIQEVSQLSPLITITDLASGSAAPSNLPVLSNEVQTVTITGTPTGGTFTLSVIRNGVTRVTAPIAYNATAAAVRAALEALDNVGVGNVASAGSAGGPYANTFQGALADENIAPMVAASALTGGSSPGVTVATSRQGGAVTLTGGNNGFSGVTDATHIGTEVGGVKTGLQAFNDMDLGRGQVVMYGVTTLAARQAMFTHASKFKRVALPDLPFAISVDDVITIRRALDTSYGALYFPTDVLVQDYANSGLTEAMYLSPFIAGVYAEAERRNGIGQAPANIQIPDALDIGTTVPGGVRIDAALHAVLAQNQINAVRNMPERGIIVYDHWVLKSSGRILAVHEQRILNQIVHDLRLTYAPLEFAINDGGGALMRSVESVTKQYLDGLGDRVLIWFQAVCNATNNNLQTMAAQQLNVDVSFIPVNSARTINVRINSMADNPEVTFIERAA